MENLKFRNLFINGKTGVGKTYLAKQIMKKAIEDQDSLRNTSGISGYSLPFGKDIYKFFNCSELMFLARKPSTGEDLYYECIKAKGLVLDDLGVGKKSDFIPDIIYIVIDKRLELGKPTIVTSNLTLQNIEEILDDRLSSRLASFEQLEIKGKDKRIIL